MGRTLKYLPSRITIQSFQLIFFYFLLFKCSPPHIAVVLFPVRIINFVGIDSRSCVTRELFFEVLQVPFSKMRSWTFWNVITGNSFFAEKTEYFLLPFTIEHFNYSLQANFEYYSTARYYVHDAKIQATVNFVSPAHRFCRILKCSLIIFYLIYLLIWAMIYKYLEKSILWL